MIKGRERYPINVRYAPALRHDVPALRRVLVPTPTGAQVPMEQLADIRLITGPAFHPRRKRHARRLCFRGHQGH